MKMSYQPKESSAPEVSDHLACACPVVCYILRMIQWHGDFPSFCIVHAARFLSPIFFHPSSESRYGSFSAVIFHRDVCLFLFPFWVATVPIITCWNTSRKHNINLVISWIYVLRPSCSHNLGFRHLLRHKRRWNQYWKGREEKVRKCSKNYDREWRLRHFATHRGIIPSKGWLPKVEAPGYFRHPTSIKRQWKPLDLWCVNGI